MILCAYIVGVGAFQILVRDNADGMFPMIFGTLAFLALATTGKTKEA